jgi:hypothetical protein
MRKSGDHTASGNAARKACKSLRRMMRRFPNFLAFNAPDEMAS